MIENILNKSYLRNLFYFTVFCFAFLLIRNAVEHNSGYNFLVWNLFLGFVPFCFILLVDLFSEKLSDIWLVFGICLWLLFYPNAPYMITDLIHVQSSSPTVIYDTLLIFSFSMLSLFFGFFSIKLVEKVLLERSSKKVTYITVAASLVLSSFGIYLGRILRLNSWDVFTKPFKTLGLIFDHLFPITKNPITYIMIILFSVIQWFLLRLIQDIENE